MTLRVFSIRHKPSGQLLRICHGKGATDIRTDKLVEALATHEREASNRIAKLPVPEEWETIERPDFDLDAMIEYAFGPASRGDAMERLGIDTIDEWLLVQSAFWISVSCLDDQPSNVMTEEFRQILAKADGFSPLRRAVIHSETKNGFAVSVTGGNASRAELTGNEDDTKSLAARLVELGVHYTSLDYEDGEDNDLIYEIRAEMRRRICPELRQQEFDATEGTGNLGDLLPVGYSQAIPVSVNGKSAGTLLNPKDARILILSGYANGVVKRHVAMRMLGFGWSRQLDEAMDEEGIERRAQTLDKKVRVYEALLHAIQLCGVTHNTKRIQELISAIDAWSYAHRCGNGEISYSQQIDLIEGAFMRLAKLVGQE